MKIKFIPFGIQDFDLVHIPKPAIQALPEWFKQMKPFTGGDTKHRLENGNKNVTIKWCNPFGDALGAGYFIFLENAVSVQKKGGESLFEWLSGGKEVISMHNKIQIDEKTVAAGYNKQPFKFHNYWGIKLPPGYSAIFTHPINRTELPFFTLTGVVDVDDYNNPVNFPFFIRDDFEGVIEAGTPIAQIIPFKREAWKMEVEKFDQLKTQSMVHKFYTNLFRPYKRFYWKRKEYK
jgi:hypothetical protein